MGDYTVGVKLSKAQINKGREEVVDQLMTLDAQIAALEEILRGYEMLKEAHDDS